MKSKSFSKCKTRRIANKGLQREVSYLKQFRSRRDRRINKMILTTKHDSDKLCNIIHMSGEREVL